MSAVPLPSDLVGGTSDAAFRSAFIFIISADAEALKPNDAASATAEIINALLYMLVSLRYLAIATVKTDGIRFYSRRTPNVAEAHHRCAHRRRRWSGPVLAHH